MYSVGEEFETLVDDEMEYLNCTANFSIGDKEYLICENESGIKRVFFYDSSEEELVWLEEDDADNILEIWEDENGMDKDYMYWNEEEYENFDSETQNISDEYDELDISGYNVLNDEDDDLISGQNYDEDDDDDEELNSFLDDFLE